MSPAETFSGDRHARDTSRPVARRRSRLRTVSLLMVGVTVVILVAIAALAGYHHLALAAEEEQLLPPGALVDVDGRMIHVSVEGKAEVGLPAIVLLAGAATIAPVYDFRALAEGLAVERQTVIVEKTGYGYSDIADVDREIESLVTETRQALHTAAVEPPYVLAPHSMSGLEALWWAAEYPDEIAGVIGLDMSTPEGYIGQSEIGIAAIASAGRLGAWLGLQRIPGLYPGLSSDALTKHEHRQQDLLLYRNAGNVSYIRESEHVLLNAEIVGVDAALRVPTLLFSSDGRDLGPGWLQAQRDLAERLGARLIELDCGHDLHHCAPELIAAESLAFLTQQDL